MSALSIISNTKGEGPELVFVTETYPYVIPKQMLFPLLSVFRVNVFYAPLEKKFGWYEDNNELFFKYMSFEIIYEIFSRKVEFHLFYCSQGIRGGILILPLFRLLTGNYKFRQF